MHSTVLLSFPVNGTKYLISTSKRRRGLRRRWLQKIQFLASWTQGMNIMVENTAEQSCLVHDGQEVKQRTSTQRKGSGTSCRPPSPTSITHPEVCFTTARATLKPVKLRIHLNYSVHFCHSNMALPLAAPALESFLETHSHFSSRSTDSEFAF